MLFHRLRPLETVKTLRKPGKISTQKATIFSPLVFHRFRPHDQTKNHKFILERLNQGQSYPRDCRDGGVKAQKVKGGEREGVRKY